MVKVDLLRRKIPHMLDALEAIVNADSPSNDLTATANCALVLSETGTALLSEEPELVEIKGRTHLRWKFGSRTKLLLLGHFDTVWPAGTTARWRFAVDGDVATGPGIFDMKAGIVQGLFALASIEDRDGIEFLLTSDEEVGSPTSRELIEAAALSSEAVLVLEPSANGALKTARKGVSGYEIRIEGRAAHAGLEPQRGANALVELANLVVAVQRIARPDDGTTVTPTVASAGTTQNTVPAAASFWVDVRASTLDEQKRVDEEIRALTPSVKGTKLEIRGGEGRPPLTTSVTLSLFNLASKIAEEIGLGSLKGVEVGGGSDGNLTGALGIPTLDGLGAVGANAHAEGERVKIPAMAERAALVAALIGELR